MNRQFVDEPANQTIVLSVSPASRAYLKPNSATRFALQQSSKSAVLGRSENADIVIDSMQVSRRHALIEFCTNGWFLSDIGSKLGTCLNRAPIPPTTQFPLKDGDCLQLGPIALFVRFNRAGSSLQSNMIGDNLLDHDETNHSSIIATELSGAISLFQENSLGGLEQNRLRLLLKSAEHFSGATSFLPLTEILTEAIAKGTNAPRAIFLDVSGPTWRVCGTYPKDLYQHGELHISRSLIRAAQAGKIAKLDVQNASWSGTESVQDLNIQTALCAPVFADGAVMGAIYLDARGSERRISPDSAAYCQAMVQLGGLAFSNLRRAEEVQRKNAMEAELREARRAQQSLMPPAAGSVSGIRYALVNQPGTIVAGDLFDVLPLDQHRTMVALGDVMGKGAGAGFIMAMVQTYLTAHASEFSDLAEFVESANRYFFKKLRNCGFVTLWIGLFDRTSRTVQFVDAGHGHWRKLTAGKAQTIESLGGPPLGMIEHSAYESDRLELSPGDRLLLFSDGLTEQVNQADDLFSSLNIFNDLNANHSPQDDVTFLSQSHESFRGDAPLSDDLTIASIQFID